MTNSEFQRYQYPVCHTLLTTQHPLSRFQSSARGHGLSRTRSLLSGDKEEQEIRGKMTNGAIGAAGFQEQMDNPSQSGDGGNRGDQDRGEEGHRVFHFPLHKACG